MPDWRSALRPQHAKLAEDQPAPAAVVSAPATDAPAVPVLGAVAPAPIAEPRTKEELDAEARVRPANTDNDVY